jgi:hypothetical protein
LLDRIIIFPTMTYDKSQQNIIDELNIIEHGSCAVYYHKSLFTK